MTVPHSTQPLQPSFVLIIHRLAIRCRDIRAEACNHIRLRNELASLDAHHLRDIGLTEQDVASAGYYPLSCDAAEKLTQMARLRSSNW